MQQSTQTCFNTVKSKKTTNARSWSKTKKSFVQHLNLKETYESQLDTEMSRTVIMPIGYKGHWKRGCFQNLLC